MRHELLLTLLLLPVLTSCQLDGPYDQISGIVVDGQRVQLVLERYWEWAFTSYQKRHRSEYYVADILAGEPAGLSRPRALLASGTWEEARFIQVQGTDQWVALVSNTDELRLTVWLTQPMDRPTTRGAEKLVELDLEEDAVAVTRSGRHLLTVTDEGLIIRNLVDGSIVDRKTDGPLVTLRNEILGRFGDSGPGTWWLTDDLRFVAFVPPWTLEDGTPIESMPVTLFGVALDLSNDGLVYDRTDGEFKRLHRLVQLGMLRDVETIEGDVLLLYGGSHPIANRRTIAVVDLDLEVRRQVEIAAPFRLGERTFQWVPRAGQVQLVGTEERFAVTTRPGKAGGTLRRISRVGRIVHVYIWNYEGGQVTSMQVPWGSIAKALPDAD